MKYRGIAELSDINIAAAPNGRARRIIAANVCLSISRIERRFIRAATGLPVVKAARLTWRTSYARKTPTLPSRNAADPQIRLRVVIIATVNVPSVKHARMARDFP